MKKISIVSCVILVSLLAFSISAGAQAKGIPGRIENQQHRITQGAAQGLLSPAEAGTLQGNLGLIRSHYENAIARGTLGQEKGRIMSMLNENSRMIGKKRHAPVRKLY
jgi:hypothetical protein